MSEVEVKTPEWVRDAVFYQIFPDRFARSDAVPKPTRLQKWGATPTEFGYQGGDLLGVLEKLDYICDLGVNALYFTPIFQSASNHRYHTHDYEKVDPMLGGDAALRKLVDEAHRRGLRVVLDGVFNHASRGFLPFNDILESGNDSAYLDWFTVFGFPLNAYDPDKPPAYKAWWGLPALPKFNTGHTPVREFLWGVARRWIDFGIDGWRLDVPNEIDDDDFWREFRRRVRAANPDAYIVGEIWTEAQRWLQGDMFDGVMNYLFTRACISFFIDGSLDVAELDKSSLRGTPNTDAAGFAREVERLLTLYHPDICAVQLNLLSSHDMARFLTLAQGDRSAMLLATMFQMTYPGAPSIYYGDEIGMLGRHDPDNRRAFPWERPESWDHDLRRQTKRLVNLRKKLVALRRGDFKMLHADAGLIVFSRRHENEVVVVALNGSTSSKRLEIDAPPGCQEGEVLEGAWSRDVIRVEGGKLRGFDLDPRSGLVFVDGVVKT